MAIYRRYRRFFQENDTCFIWNLNEVKSLQKVSIFDSRPTFNISTEPCFHGEVFLEPILRGKDPISLKSCSEMEENEYSFPCVSVIWTDSSPSDLPLLKAVTALSLYFFSGFAYTDPVIICGYRLVVGRVLAKDEVGVRFSLPAPKSLDLRFPRSISRKVSGIVPIIER